MDDDLEFDFGGDLPVAVSVDTEDADVSLAARALENNLWDDEAWGSLLAIAEHKSLPTARTVYERCLRLFPTSSAAWLAYMRREEADGGVAAVEALLERGLLLTLDPEVWHYYVSFIYRVKYLPAEAQLAAARAAAVAATASGASGTSAHDVAVQTALAAAIDTHTTTRAQLLESFEFAISNVGSAFHAGAIWELYISFLKSAPESNPIETSHKRDALRKAYQRGVALAHSAVARMWVEYCEYEKSISQAVLAASLIQQHQTSATTATAVAMEREALWVSIDTHALARFPAAAGATGGSTPSEACKAWDAKILQWRRVLAYELANPLMLDRARHHAQSRLTFRQCLAVCRFCPDVWHDYATYEAHGPEGATEGSTPHQLAAQVYEEGLALMPTSVSLALAAADFHELHKQGAAADGVYKSLLERLHEFAGCVPPSNWSWRQLDKLEPAASGSSTGANAGSFLSAEDVTSATAMITQVYIIYMRYARRSGGTDASRSVFKAARSSPRVLASVYLAAAHSEYFSNRALSVARNIIELGRKRYAQDIEYILSSADFLSVVDESTNVRAFLEAALTDLPPGDSRPVFDRYIDYELRHAQNGGSLEAVVALEARRAAVHPHLAGLHARLLARQMHRYVEYGSLPASRCDGDFFRRHPYAPFAVLPVDPAAPRATQMPTFPSPATCVLSAFPSSFHRSLLHKDGLYHQAPTLHASPLSHVPQAYMTPLQPGTVPVLLEVAHTTPAPVAHAPLSTADAVSASVPGAGASAVPATVEVAAVAGSKRAHEATTSSATIEGGAAVAPPPKRRGVLGFS